ncbi:DUF6174 domain-containing protein [Krasilnikovia sp. MM14-A1004]|uniref:DUF6174 domain-containing protein n=1 Tax=Krasilnikovia sp. MM14-A1004 TaxID=3373541 RepID=UPI00399CBD76
MRPAKILCLAVVSAAIGGCAAQPGYAQPGYAEAGTAPEAAAATPRAWSEPQRYRFVLESSCGERTLLGRFEVTVEAGKVTRTVGLDDPARRALRLRLAELVPTLGQLAAEASTARHAGADEVVTESDPVDGHPVSIRIDPSRAALDDESCYAVSGYTVE